MDDFPSLLTRDFGLKPQGKSAPMAPQRSASVRTSGFGSNAYFSSQSASIFDDNDHGDDKLFSDGLNYSDQEPKGSGTWTGSSTTANSSSFDYDSTFKERNSKSSSLPVFDKPIYDEDIFDGLPGVKNASTETSTFGSSFPNSNSELASSPTASQTKTAAFDDLLEGFQKNDSGEQSKKTSGKNASPLFDDLLPGFNRSSRSTAESNQSNKSFNDSGRKPLGIVEDPFASLHPSPDVTDSSSGFFADPLNDLGSNYDSFRTEKPVPSFDDLDSLAKIGKPAPNSTGLNNKGKIDSFPSFDMLDKPKFDSVDTQFQVKTTANNLHDLGESEPEIPFSSSFHNYESSTPKPEDSVEEVWLTVSEIPLFTEPTKAPPPARPPPPRPPRFSRLERKAATDSFPPTHENLDDYAMGSGQHDEFKENPSEAAASAAAMEEAMGMAEATFRQMREREYPIPTRTKEASSQADQERFELERQREEEKEREEKVRLEKEKEAERERERARQAVERATREARERAANEARLKAEKAAVERASNEARQRAARIAVQRVQAEARERAAAEAREKAERAAAEAKERAEAETKADEARRRAKVEAETKARNERAAVERAASEARQRAAAAAAAAAKANQQRHENTYKEDNDIESFFNARASSAPTRASDPFFDKAWPEANSKAPATSAANMRKASSATNIVDDLSSIFGGPPSSTEFQEVEGETEERRKARKERHQRTKERAAKALAEKNERDLQLQREQSERHRIAETIDVEIKRWAAGKEGNLRALLSTLQYALWPECGWQPVSLTDLITAAAVKKVYRKATLCIHPDKVQQKGATLQQKYIAEKVFDLLKEAWNKFNSEELF